MKTYIANKAYKAEKNTILDTLDLSLLVDSKKYKLKNAWINVGGWQSWNPGFEIEPGRKQPALKCHFINGWNKYLVFPESKFRPSKNCVLGQFVTYLRWENFYIVFASVGNVNDCLPPVQFIFNRKNNTVSFEIYDKGKYWTKGELQSKIEIYISSSYFECKNKLTEIFDCGQFNQLFSLGNNPAGWESWYNHYANIDEKMILDNLYALTNTDNIISKGNYTSKIFQIDDGWEQSLGDWDYRKDKFPNGLKSIVEKIEQKGFIPGLWLAPFIIDSRSKTALEHPEWLLKDLQGKLIISGFNPLWGEKGNFYCLDLSNDEVLEHLCSIIDRVINEWGFRYLKLDFLYAGMFYGSFKNPEAAYKIYTNAIKILTSKTKTSSGKSVNYLGCGIPFESSFKYFPLSRIGCDTLEHWKNKKLRLINWNGRNEAYLNLKDTLGHALWDKTIFANDPDVVFIRENNCSLTKNEKILISCVNSFFGSQFMYSDDPSKKETEAEIIIRNEMLELMEKYKNEKLGITQIKKDLYEIFNSEGVKIAKLDIGKKRNIEFYKGACTNENL